MDDEISQDWRDWLREQPASVQSDFRRREDIARGVIQTIGGIWDSKFSQCEALKRMESSKGPVIAYTVIGFSLLVHWLLVGEEGGMSLAIWVGIGAFYYLLVREFERFKLRGAYKFYSAQESLLRAQWISSGAWETQFWELRDTYRAKIVLERESQDTDEWRRKHLDLEKKWGQLLHKASEEIARRACG